MNTVIGYNKKVVFDFVFLDNDVQLYRVVPLLAQVVTLDPCFQNQQFEQSQVQQENLVVEVRWNHVDSEHSPSLL